MGHAWQHLSRHYPDDLLRDLRHLYSSDAATEAALSDLLS